MIDLNKFKSILSPNELISLNLRYLYNEYGYKQYKMSKFEEYDLYAKNKDFLISDNVITFTDTDGRLLALKPDVTLSIIKNGRDSRCDVVKTCYNENVYRVSGGTKSFKEIMQVGLECIGDLSTDDLIETVILAKKSLELISVNNVLEISQLDIISAVLDNVGLSESGRAEFINLLSGKNIGGIKAFCNKMDLSGADCELLLALSSVNGSILEMKDKLACFSLNEKAENAIKEIQLLCDKLVSCNITDGVILDFSGVGDMNYYNGLCFTGYIQGIPSGVLSGGQYDKLMKKMKRNDRAIGFAVYLDELEDLPR